MVRPPNISPTMISSTRSWCFSPILTMRGQSPAWWTVREAKIAVCYAFVAPSQPLVESENVLICTYILCVRSQTRSEEGDVLLL